MNDYDTTSEKGIVPSGAAHLATDTNGHDHYFAAGVKDRRVFIADGREILEVHDLETLAAAGAIPAPTPRAWLDAFDADCAGIATDRLGMNLTDQLVEALDREAQA